MRTSPDSTVAVVIVLVYGARVEKLALLNSFAKLSAGSIMSATGGCVLVTGYEGWANYDTNPSQLLAESVADLKRLEQVRLQDNREAATDLESWEHERRALNARVEELTAMLKHRPWVLDEQSLPGPVPGHLSPAPFAGASSRRADESPDAWRAVLVDDGNNRVDELRGKLAEMQHETDVAVLSPPCLLLNARA